LREDRATVRDLVVPTQHVRSFLISEPEKGQSASRSLALWTVLTPEARPPTLTNPEIDIRLISAPDFPHAENDIAVVQAAQPVRIEKTFVRKISTDLAPIAPRSAA